MGGVEEILLAVVVGRGGNDHEVRVPVGGLSVKGGGELQRLGSQIFLDVIVLDRGDPVVDFLYLLCNHIHCCYLVTLRKQCRD